jgi:hypothetical protein
MIDVISGTASTIFELSLMADLLTDAANRHEQHTSTDYILQNDDDHRAIIVAAMRFERDAEESEPDEAGELEVGDGLFVPDYCLMRYLGARCRQVAGRGEPLNGVLPAKRLNRSELTTIAKLLSELSADEFGEYAHDEDDADLFLDASDEHKAFAVSVLQRAGAVKARISAVRNAKENLEINAVDVLAYLAQRCAAAALVADATDADLAPATAQAPALQPLGIYKGWKTEKALLKEFAAYLDNGTARLQKKYADLKMYAEGGNPFKDIIDETKPRQGALMLPVIDALYGDPTAVGDIPYARMYSGRPASEWLPAYEQAVGYKYWRWCVGCQAQGTWLTIFLDAPAILLADCLTLGWLDQARLVAETTRAEYQKRLIGAVSGKDCQPLFHWLLRVVFDFWNMPFDGWGKGKHVSQDPQNVFAKNQCFGEPVLNTLFDHWRDPDLSPYADHLVWLCDYYTHRTRHQQFMEFNAGGSVLARFPTTVLAFVRMRQCLGLATPPIDHPLMKAPCSQLPPKRPVYTDPLLEKVLDRLRREELPDLGGGVETAIKFVDSR